MLKAQGRWRLRWHLNALCIVPRNSQTRSADRFCQTADFLSPFQLLVLSPSLLFYLAFAVQLALKQVLV